jgi:hypothetical protein
MISKLASLQKIEASAFDLHCQGLLPALWAMSDRSVRSALLQSLKQMAPYTEASTVNKSIFDHMVAGFADSNAK